MSQSEVLPAPRIEQPPVASGRWSKWKREREAFWRLLPTLLPTHRGKYVAIHEGAVIDSDVDQIALALRVYGTGCRQVYVGLIAAEPSQVVRVPSPRLLMPGTSP